MLGELLPTGGGDPIPLLKARLLVGRRDGCDISLRFPNVSSHHCELELINGYWKVRDLGSRNGTKVNGVRVESTWLLPGDELSVAKHRYEVKYLPEGDAPPPETEDVFAVPLLEKAGLAAPGSERPRRPVRPAEEGDSPAVNGNGDRGRDGVPDEPGLEDEPAALAADGRLPSLLEAAGLTSRRTEPSRPAALPALPAPRTQKKPPESDESIALSWLDAAGDDGP